MVYDKAWGDADTMTRRFRLMGWDLTYADGNDPLDFSIGPKMNGARWLLTSKQMLNEGTQQLYRESTCHLSNVYDAMLFNANGPRILTPFSTRSYAIHFGLGSFHFSVSKRTYQISPNAINPVNRILRWAASTSQVQKFQVIIQRPYQEPKSTKNRANFGFDPRRLELLKGHENLKRFEVHLLCDMDDTVRLTKHWRVGKESRARRLEDHYLESFKTEFERLGKSLIKGSEMKGYMKESTRKWDGHRQLTWWWVFEKP